MKRTYLLAGILFLCNFCKAQRKIYFEVDKRNGKTIELKGDKLTYSDPVYPNKIDTVLWNDAVWLFNDKGKFLILSKKDTSNLTSKDPLQEFLDRKKDSSKNTDRLFTIQKKEIDCTILNEEKNTITVSINGVEANIDRSIVCLIIYKNGDHKIFSTMALASAVLASFQLNRPGNILAFKKVPEKIKLTPLKNDPNKSNDTDEDKSVWNMPNKSQPKTKPDKEALLKQNEIDMKYDFGIKGADDAFNKGDYAKAKRLFKAASILKPEEKYPKEMLQKILVEELQQGSNVPKVP